MFLDNSRYARQTTVQATTASGRAVTAVPLRRLPTTAGDPLTLRGNDRLDVIALRKYNDGTRYWHIADANTELEAHRLLEPANPDEPNPPQLIILVPGK